MFKMSAIGRNACVQTFTKVVDSFVDGCLRQAIPDLLQNTFQLWNGFLALDEFCEMPEA